MTDKRRQELICDLEARYGPMVGGRDLYMALGFRRYAAFYRCLQKGEIGMNVFTLTGRRGWFALTRDVAQWLSEKAETAGKPSISVKDARFLP